MNSKYKVLKFNSNKFENFEDLVSIEEPVIKSQILIFPSRVVNASLVPCGFQQTL